MKTEFTPPTSAPPADPKEAAVVAADRALELAKLEAQAATDRVRAAEQAARKAAADLEAERLRRQEEAERLSIEEREKPILERAAKLKDGIRSALAYVSSVLTERERLERELARLRPGFRTQGHLPRLEGVEPKSGRGQMTFLVNFEQP